MKTNLPLVLAISAIATLGRNASCAEPITPTFENHVRPILKAYCFDCHGDGEKPKGGLDLRLRRLIEAGGDTGPAVVAGKPGESLLFQHVREQKMPPTKKKLSKDEVEVIRGWIAGGAKVERPEPAEVAQGMLLTDEDRAWWSFQPIKKLAPPPASENERARSPVDAWLLLQLRAKKFGFNADADKVTLLRRVTFDLIGLPPTPAEVDAFVNDQSPDAYEKVIDRLLASPQYGERWARHWLDVAGYADSEGYSPSDPVRTNAWKYRDYVIRSFNADKPFDEFVREQLAGDEMVKRPFTSLPPADLDKLIATGFLRMSPDGTGDKDADQKVARNQVIADTIKTVSTSLLGLTVTCAQCHNHRYDPIPQSDFYRMRALLEPSYNTTAWKPPAARQVSLALPGDKKKAADLEAEAAKIDAARLKRQQELIDATLEKEYAKLPDDVREKVRAARNTPLAKQTAMQKSLLQLHPSVNVSAGSLYLYDKKAADELAKQAEEAAAIRARKPKDETIRALTEDAVKLPETFLFHRGDPDQPKQAVAPGALAILDDRFPLKVVKPADLPTSGRRLAFAKWVTDARNPLFARVIVNRMWMEHFGRGLVGTPGDFGRLGERPTHPELLDWLAAEFRDNGWSLKNLHKLILTSTVYRQSSWRDKVNDAADPDNRLYGRFPLRRLDAEAIRDGMLAVTGKLTDRMNGPPVPVRENDAGQFVLGNENRDGAGRFVAEVKLAPGEEFRRSIYIQVRRSKPYGVLDTFDWATTEPNCESRSSSTVPTQSLMLLNSEFLAAQSEAFAERLAKAETIPEKRIALAFRLAYGVEPTTAETAKAIGFLREQTALFQEMKPVKGAPTPADRALGVFCQAVLMSNRFLYVD